MSTFFPEVTSDVSESVDLFLEVLRVSLFQQSSSTSRVRDGASGREGSSHSEK